MRCTQAKQFKSPKGARVVLSCKYDPPGTFQTMDRIAEYIEKEYPYLKVYNPNRYSKEHCGETCSLTGYNCKKYPFSIRRSPHEGD